MKEYIEQRARMLGVPKEIEVSYIEASKQLRIGLKYYYIGDDYVDEDIYHAVRDWLECHLRSTEYRQERG